jgi:hypothetical protein
LSYWWGLVGERAWEGRRGKRARPLGVDAAMPRRVLALARPSFFVDDGPAHPIPRGPCRHAHPRHCARRRRLAMIGTPPTMTCPLARRHRVSNPSSCVRPALAPRPTQDTRAFVGEGVEWKRPGERPCCVFGCATRGRFGGFFEFDYSVMSALRWSGVGPWPLVVWYAVLAQLQSR